jgi:predicted AAA+ superfamily ATPase
LRRYVDVLAENTAGLPSESALLDAGAINARTASDYDRLLQSLGVLDIVPAWSTNRLKRLTQRGKRYLTDTGLTAGALRVDAADLLREGDLLGRIIDAYVTAQIRAEIAASELLPNLFHLRDRDGHEVDLLLDYGRRGLIGVEIKASASPTRADAAHLWWLQEHVPDFRAGLVLHTGSKMYRLYDGIAAVPIAALWK